MDILEEKEDVVEVRFNDGKIENYDLVVGAEGVKSRTRKMMRLIRCIRIMASMLRISRCQGPFSSAMDISLLYTWH